MATVQIQAGRRTHPIVWVLVGVVGTLAAVAGVSYGRQFVARQSTLPSDGASPSADVVPPFPPVLPERVPANGITVVVQKPSAEAADQLPPSQSPSASLKDIPERTFTSPEEVIKAYIGAKRWEDRLPCVLNPKAVRQLMAARYKNWDVATAVNEFRPGAVTVKPNAGDKVIVDVDVRESLPYHQKLRYSVVKSGVGYKVDWLDSLELGEEDNLRAEVNEFGLTTPVLEIQVVKRYQSGTYAKYDLRVVNRSNRMVGYWGVEASVYDGDGKYLGKAMTNGTNLKAGDEAIDDIAFVDVSYTAIASWKPRIDSVRIEFNTGRSADATKHFSLNELKPRSW